MSLAPKFETIRNNFFFDGKSMKIFEIKSTKIPLVPKTCSQKRKKEISKRFSKTPAPKYAQTE